MRRDEIDGISAEKQLANAIVRRVRIVTQASEQVGFGKILEKHGNDDAALAETSWRNFPLTLVHGRGFRMKISSQPE